VRKDLSQQQHKNEDEETKRKIETKEKRQMANRGYEPDRPLSRFRKHDFVVVDLHLQRRPSVRYLIVVHRRSTTRSCVCVWCVTRIQGWRLLLLFVCLCLLDSTTRMLKLRKKNRSLRLVLKLFGAKSMDLLLPG